MTRSADMFSLRSEPCIYIHKLRALPRPYIDLHLIDMNSPHHMEALIEDDSNRIGRAENV